MRNSRKLERSQVPFIPAEARERSTRRRSGFIHSSRRVVVSVLSRELCGIDGDEPWVASCDTHGEMLCCPTKASAIRATSQGNRDWCSGCAAIERRADPSVYHQEVE
jgi:hypothetical protein